MEHRVPNVYYCLGEFAPNLDVARLIMLPLFQEAKEMGIVLEVLDKAESVATMAASKSLGKATYATWLRFFDEENDSRSGYIMETFLTYLLSCKVFPSGPKDGMNPDFFFLVILIGRGYSSHRLRYTSTSYTPSWMSACKMSCDLWGGTTW